MSRVRVAPVALIEELVDELTNKGPPDFGTLDVVVRAQEWLKETKSPPAAPGPGDAVWKCPKCRGTNVEVQVRTWYDANLLDRVSPCEAFTSTDSDQSLSEFYCNDCGTDVFAEKEIVPE